MELGSSCKVMLMVITNFSLIPMDWVEKHSWQRKRGPEAKGLPGGQWLGGVLELAGLGNVPTMFSGKALLIKRISGGFPMSRGKPPLTPALPMLSLQPQKGFCPWGWRSLGTDGDTKVSLRNGRSRR